MIEEEVKLTQKKKEDVIQLSEQAIKRYMDLEKSGKDIRDNLKLLVLHHSLLLSADSVMVDTEALEKIQGIY